MKEAIGGVFSLEFIIIFLLILNGYLAFNVNYTKAFRVKNEIRSIIQKNEGLTASAMTDIDNYMQKVHYTQNDGYTQWCMDREYYVCEPQGGTNRKFCMEMATDSKYGVDSKGNEIAVYYTIYTFVDVRIPVLDRFLPELGNLFSVTGETALIYSKATPDDFEALVKDGRCVGGPSDETKEHTGTAVPE